MGLSRRGLLGLIGLAPAGAATGVAAGQLRATASSEPLVIGRMRDGEMVGPVTLLDGRGVVTFKFDVDRFYIGRADDLARDMPRSEAE